MALANLSHPTSLSFSATNLGFPGHGNSVDSTKTIPFHHETNYLALNRMLLRYQHLILLTPSPSMSSSTELNPLQTQIQAELYSPLPYHRSKWLHNIERARTILLQLERAAQGIKVQRAKRDAVQDLAEKRVVIKKLRARIEEIGAEVEAEGEKAWQRPVREEGQTVYEILGKSRPSRGSIGGDSQSRLQSAQDLADGKPVKHVEETLEQEGNDEGASDHKRRLGTSSTVRRRGQGPTSHSEGPDAKTSSFSNLESTERALLDSSRTHEDLTVSLVSMAAQLKQQARAFQFSLDQDKGLLDRALEGLDRNLTGMEAASKNMAFLRRMSEGQGWFGRMKLYAMIFGMWVVAILLVFVGPKLRF